MPRMTGRGRPRPQVLQSGLSYPLGKWADSRLDRNTVLLLGFACLTLADIACILATSPYLMILGERPARTAATPGTPRHGRTPPRLSVAFAHCCARAPSALLRLRVEVAPREYDGNCRELPVVAVWLQAATGPIQAIGWVIASTWLCPAQRWRLDTFWTEAYGAHGLAGAAVQACSSKGCTCRPRRGT